MRPFPNVSGGQWQVSTAGGTRPLWSRDGTELFYIGPDERLMGVRVMVSGAAWNAGVPAKVLDIQYYLGNVGNVGRTYDVSPDGRRFLMIKGTEEDTAAASQIVLVQNWLEELKRLVPTD